MDKMAAQLAWLRIHGINAELEDGAIRVDGDGLERLIRMAEWMGGECEWFAMCTEPAEHWRTHPVLGVVPVCDQHYTWEGGK